MNFKVLAKETRKKMQAAARRPKRPPRNVGASRKGGARNQAGPQQTGAGVKREQRAIPLPRFARMLPGMMVPDPTPSAAPPARTAPGEAPPHRGLLIVMTGASGVGKGTLRERWLAGQDVFYSTSWTTREARPSEQDGVDYVFVTPEVFQEKVWENGFLEHAQFVGNHYGTPREPIEAALARGQDVVLEIEVEGAMQVKGRVGEDAVLIFIMPPSLTELRRRLTGRATETPERIEKRLTRARDEIMHAHAFRYVVVNDDLERAVNELRAVQRAEHARLRPASEWTEEDREALRLAETVRSTALTREDLLRVVEG